VSPERLRIQRLEREKAELEILVKRAAEHAAEMENQLRAVTLNAQALEAERTTLLPWVSRGKRAEERLERATRLLERILARIDDVLRLED